MRLRCLPGTAPAAKAPPNVMILVLIVGASVLGAARDLHALAEFAQAAC